MAIYDKFADDNTQVSEQDLSGSMAEGNNQPNLEIGFWDPMLTHQLRVLLYAEPLLKLRSRDEHRPAEMKHYDSLTLALKLFNEIIEHTGLEHEIDSNAAINILVPLLEAMDQTEGIPPDLQRQRHMAEGVLAILCNDRAFKVVYTDFDRAQAVERTLAVRLLEERYHNDGHIVLSLSNELTNLLLNALSVDIEDAQAAAEAIIQSQLARGRLYEAINSARLARFHSIRLRTKVERLLIDTRRDLSRVDWKDDVPRILSESLEHIATRCNVEMTIAKSAREKREPLDPESKEIRQLSEIIALVEDCHQRHMELQQQLSIARRVFFEEQERQSFTLRTSMHLPNFLGDVLEPLLQTHRNRVETTLMAMWPLCLGARAPHVFSLSQYILHQLQPRRELKLETVPEEERELVSLENDKSYYTPESIQRAENYMAILEEPMHLGTLLQRAIDANESSQVIDLLALLALRDFAPEEKHVPLFKVIKVNTRQFCTARISGDDVLIVPQIVPQENANV